MIIKSAEFITSLATIGSYLDESGRYTCREICVVGRSNVGKSSFINMVTARNKLAKTSSTPGRTRLINLFSINSGEFMLVDLPGYGFAEAAKTKQKEWSELIEQYIMYSKKILQVIVLVDARHKPSALDKIMLNYLYHYQLPFTVVLTKIDKLSKAELARNITMIAAELSVGKDNLIPVSNEKNINREAVLDKFSQWISNQSLD